MGGKKAGLNKVSRKRHTMKFTFKQTFVLREVFHRGNSKYKTLNENEVDGETAH